MIITFIIGHAGRASTAACPRILSTGLQERGSSEADHPGRLSEPVQKYDGLLPEGRVHKVGRNLTQGLQDETAVRNAGMGNGQLGIGIDNIVKE
jgi:hypothetical protein